eukprot:TRINITY_DN12214_c0_g9_i1.p1 TRINITY_DN12214_c0_g9~~TRINITY_DN12214_c0_g9_i1.p1  ORF type:complete len:544 (-),score=100.29 TRINITY_DN12214_c0_g9_i1:49-1479(-)
MDDSWFRDTGPTFIVRDHQDGDGQQRRDIAGVDWLFNSWGGEDEGCYKDWKLDSLVAKKILNLEKIQRFPIPLVMEGGSFHVDGEGTLITTEECLLNQNRNPSMTREEIEMQLRLYLAVEKIIWLPKGVYGDKDTNGHVDNLACFARPGVVLLAWEENENDPQHAISKAAYDILSNTTDARGRPLQVIKLPVPGPLYYTAEDIATLEDGPRKSEVLEGLESGDLGATRMAASYVNFYIANGAIIMPGFEDEEKDALACNIIRSTFPNRQVIMVQTRAILLGGGNIHCITQQQPALQPPPQASLFHDPPHVSAPPASHPNISTTQFLDLSPSLAPPPSNNSPRLFGNQISEPGTSMSGLLDLNEGLREEHVVHANKGNNSFDIDSYKPNENRGMDHDGGGGGVGPLLDLNADLDRSHNVAQQHATEVGGADRFGLSLGLSQGSAVRGAHQADMPSNGGPLKKRREGMDSSGEWKSQW